MFAVAQTLALTAYRPKMKNALGRVHPTRSLTIWIKLAGRTSFGRPPRVVTKNDSCPTFMTNDFPSHNKSAGCGEVHRRFRQMRRPLGTAKHTGMEDRNNEARFKLCLECIGFNSF